MTVVATSPETFNNRLVLERDLWQRQSRQFECVPKTRVFGGFEMHSAF
jgi:hypothetical protein